jgi:flagellar hook protein FlgE
MSRALFAGLSGTLANQTLIDVLGNNIANANTVGFKEGRLTFQDTFYQTLRGGRAGSPTGSGGTDPIQVGSGVAPGQVQAVHTQGSLRYTGAPLDAAVEGTGMFVLRDGPKQVYTRDGSFALDSTHTLVSGGTGLKVMGWLAQDGVVTPTGTVGELVFPLGEVRAGAATSSVTTAGNLDAGLAVDVTTPATKATMSSAATIGAAADTFASDQTAGFDALDEVSLYVNGTKVDITTNAQNTNIGNATTWQDIVDAITAQQSALGVTAAITGGELVISSLATGSAQNLSVEYRKVTDPGADLDLTKALAGAGENLTASAVGVDAVGSGGRQNATISVYDTLGALHQVTLTFTKSVTANQWTCTAEMEGTSATANLAFDGATGALTSGSPLSVSGPVTSGATTPLAFDIDLSRITQLAQTGSNVLVVNQDGKPSSTLSGVSIIEGGDIQGDFSDGHVEVLGKLAAAAFGNVGGLVRTGNNLYQEGADSGVVDIGAPGIASRGQVRARSLENSNVDLTSSFVEIMTAQRGFQASARVISAANRLLDDVMQLNIS